MYEIIIDSVLAWARPHYFKSNQSLVRTKKKKNWKSRQKLSPIFYTEICTDYVRSLARASNGAAPSPLINDFIECSFVYWKSKSEKWSIAARIHYTKFNEPKSSSLISLSFCSMRKCDMGVGKHCKVINKILKFVLIGNPFANTILVSITSALALSILFDFTIFSTLVSSFAE